MKLLLHSEIVFSIENLYENPEDDHLLQNSFQNSFLNEKVDFSDLQSEFDNLF